MKDKINTYFPINLLTCFEMILFSTITLAMLIVEYYGWQAPFHFYIGQTSWYQTISPNDRYFYAQIWTTLSFIIFLVILPSLIYRLTLKDINWMIKKPNPQSGLQYCYLYLLMFPVLLFVSRQEQFYRFYPLYRPNDLTDWIKFELVYLPQFFAIEYFFRGPSLALASKIKKEIAPVIMMLPYALIHIHKPFPEAIGSMIAGLVLGHLSLKSNSIWFGVLLHMAIALSMDSLGLFHSGFFN